MENKQTYCLWEECNWTCDNQKHGLFILVGFFACPILILILFAFKYMNIKTNS